jgi:endonuclease I
MKNIQTVLLFLCLLAVSFANAQAPQGYYASAEGKSGEALRTALYNIIKTHNSVSYNELWQSFYTTDKRPDNGKVWDIYSDRPGSTPSYYFTFGSDQCGNYSGEGDCYNREHSVPKSWFGGSVAPMYTDLFHLYPTDGYVNSKRSNLPIGKVVNATWTSSNGSKVGTSNISGYSGQVFEPIDSFKGDFARTYFYMAVCYKDKNLGVETLSNFSGGDLKPWAKELLLQWAALDPVSQKEISRNNAVYQIQQNRNPFIDYPELAEKIFGNDATPFSVGISSYADSNQWQVYPNPTFSIINIQPFEYQTDIATIEIRDIAGKTLRWQQSEFSDNIQINLSELPNGLYFLTLSSPKHIHTYKIVKQ